MINSKSIINTCGKLLHQPKPFYLIFFLEFWERYGYLGIQSLFIVFFVKKLGFTDAHGDGLYSAFTAMAFLLPCIGGYVGDKIIGTKRAIALGAIILTIGYSSLAFVDQHSIYLSLALIAVGVGIFKANPSSLLSKIYQGDKSKLDAGFTLYFMAINLGALFGGILLPFITLISGFHYAFIGCASGLVFALIAFYSLISSVKEFGSAPDFHPLKMTSLIKIIGLIFVLITATAWFLFHYTLTGNLIYIGAVIATILFCREVKRAAPSERSRMILCFLLIGESIVFFILYNQAGMSLTLFALRNTDHLLLGIHVHPSTYYGLDAFWIVVLSPLLALLYQYLASKNKDLSLAMKFAIGTASSGLLFVLLAYIGKHLSTQGIISGNWFILVYFFEAIGELLVAGLGLAMVAHYVPERLMGFTMGLWFLCVSLASIFSGKIAMLATIPQNVYDPAQSMPIYTHLFGQLGMTTLIAAIVMALLAPLLNRLDK